MNTHDVALVAARTGPVLVTLLFVTNSQIDDARRTTAEARRLASAVLARATHRLT